MAMPRPSARTYTPFFAAAHRPLALNIPHSADGSINETGSGNIAGDSSSTANQDNASPSRGPLDTITVTAARGNPLHLISESRWNGNGPEDAVVIGDVFGRK